MHQDNILASMVDRRYLSFSTTELGKKIEEGKATLDDCESFVLKNGEPATSSAKQEKFEQVFNNYFV